MGCAACVGTSAPIVAEVTARPMSPTRMISDQFMPTPFRFVKGRVQYGENEKKSRVEKDFAPGIDSLLCFSR